LVDKTEVLQQGIMPKRFFLFAALKGPLSQNSRGFSDPIDPWRKSVWWDYHEPHFLSPWAKESKIIKILHDI